MLHPIFFNGSTPFRVFIEVKAFVPTFVPKEERGLSDKGYLTIEIFRYIIQEFKKLMDIVQKDRCNDIHFINIMHGSSHWFHVHDQQPFGQLKKKNDEGSEK